jgi:hypothetical protein
MNVDASKTADVYVYARFAVIGFFKHPPPSS